MFGYALFTNVGSADRPVYTASIFLSEDAAKGQRDFNGGNGIIRLIEMGCERCLRLDSTDVQHYNCMYNGQAIGHSKAHCTANACF